MIHPSQCSVHQPIHVSIWKPQLLLISDIQILENIAMPFSALSFAICLLVQPLTAVTPVPLLQND